MSRQIYVNLPVKDLGRSVDFFSRLGFTFDPRFPTRTRPAWSWPTTSPSCCSWRRSSWASPTSICDTGKATEVMQALSRADRAEVDELVRKALVAGGTAPRRAQDLGFMYSHDFEDPDGHIWEPFHMEPGGPPG